MPIKPALNLASISDAAFAETDQVVMRSAYAVHNKFGRRFDERVYENDLAERLRAEGLEVRTQVPISVSHAGFVKDYFLDLVVERMVYELKVVSALVREHDAQALHYAMLQDVRLVKLLNFGGERVKGRLLRNPLSISDRHSPVFRKTGFRPVTQACERIVEWVHDLVTDWGTHLSGVLYRDALIFLGGKGFCVDRVELKSRGIVLGTHWIPSHSNGWAFEVTSLTRDPSSYRRHLELLASLAGLRGIQWINFNHSSVEFETVFPAPTT